MHPDWARHLRDQCLAAGVCRFPMEPALPTAEYYQPV